jgi:hypothetical protein
MIKYLLSVLLCSLLFYTVYVLWLEKENMHGFKRFYLLFSLVFSIAAPFISLRLPVPSLLLATAPALQEQQILQNRQTGDIEYFQPELFVFDDVINDAQTETATSATVAPTPYSVTITIYVLIAAVFVLRLLVNLFRIFKLSRRSEIVQRDGICIALLDEKLAPHSFGRYIFVNRDEYCSGQIADEIIMHEAGHVRQRHSFDIVFVELLVAVLWFNPVFWLFRTKIKQNHEFLADAGVLNVSRDIAGYQLLLLDAVCRKQGMIPTINFNCLITKKRFIMMTKQTSPRRAFCKALALVPLFMFALAVFSTKTGATDGLPSVPDRADSNLIAAVHAPIANHEVAATVLTLDAATETTPESQYPATVNDAKTDGDEVIPFSDVEVKPRFNDGHSDNFMSWLHTQIKNNSLGELLTGNKPVYLSFIIGETGSISNVAVQSSENAAFDKAVIEIIKKSPAWIPGQHRGKPVKTLYKGTYFNLDAAFRSLDRDGKHHLLFVNGVECSRDSIMKIVPETIVSITVLKDETAVSLFGEHGRDGVIAVRTKDGHDKGIEMLKTFAESRNKAISVRNFDRQTLIREHPEAIVYVNDVECPADTIEKIDQSLVQSISILANETAVRIYGERGRKGVILVVTRTSQQDANDNSERKTAVEEWINANMQYDSNENPELRMLAFEMQKIRLL